jgi:hypothetical protein
MNFKNKTDIIRFSRCVVFPPVPPLSHFAASAGMRGRQQRIWDSEGKKREKGRNDNFCFYFVRDNSESQLPGASKEETYMEDEDELLDFLYSHGELVSSYLVSSPNMSSQNWNVIYEVEVDVAPVVSSTPPTPKSHSETHGFKSMRPVLKRLTDEDLKKFGVGRKSSVSQLALTTSLTTADSHETKYYEFCTFGKWILLVLGILIFVYPWLC